MAYLFGTESRHMRGTLEVHVPGSTATIDGKWMFLEQVGISICEEEGCPNGVHCIVVTIHNFDFTGSSLYKRTLMALLGENIFNRILRGWLTTMERQRLTGWNSLSITDEERDSIESMIRNDDGLAPQVYT